MIPRDLWEIQQGIQPPESITQVICLSWAPSPQQMTGGQRPCSKEGSGVWGQYSVALTLLLQKTFSEELVALEFLVQLKSDKHGLAELRPKVCDSHHRGHHMCLKQTLPPSRQRFRDGHVNNWSDYRVTVSLLTGEGFGGTRKQCRVQRKRQPAPRREGFTWGGDISRVPSVWLGF